ncbi:hypothetical protein K438DRAFT_1968854 [Mycena galopus ATCC 62051]|nr:hypothetical protein K438DRAFT_1968854 [Mycena galopus ATCC 62051]
MLPPPLRFVCSTPTSTTTSPSSRFVAVTTSTVASIKVSRRLLNWYQHCFECSPPYFLPSSLVQLPHLVWFSSRLYGRRPGSGSGCPESIIKQLPVSKAYPSLPSLIKDNLLMVVVMDPSKEAREIRPDRISLVATVCWHQEAMMVLEEMVEEAAEDSLAEAELAGTVGHPLTHSQSPNLWVPPD